MTLTRTPHAARRTLALATAAAGLAALTACGSGATPASTATSGTTSSKATTSAAASTTGAGQTSAAATSAGKKLTMAEVATHNTASSCWAVVSGTVYDLTEWIGRHPGGPDKIKGLCGTDASRAFADQHGKAGPDGKPQNRLKTFALGPLVS